jgi:hypothetical protein
MEGLYNIILLGFKPTMTKNKQQITNTWIFSLLIPRKMQDQTLVHQAITIQEQVRNPPRGVHRLASSIHQEITPKIICKRERETKMLKSSENSAISLLTMGEL